MDTTEGNRLIAEFMGFKDESRFIGGGNYVSRWNPGRIGRSNTERYSFSELKYDSSFDWLYPVITKIENLGCKFTSFPSETKQNYYISQIMTYANEKFKTNEFFDATDDSRIISFHKAVVGFVQWYTSSKENKGHQAAPETGVFPLPVEEKLPELEVRQFLDDLQEKLRTTKRSDLAKERIASLKEANAPKEQIESYEKILAYFLENGL